MLDTETAFIKRYLAKVCKCMCIHEHTIEYAYIRTQDNSVLRKQEILPFSATWINVEYIILAEMAK